MLPKFKMAARGQNFVGAKTLKLNQKLFKYSGTPVMQPQLLPHKNGHMRGVVVCQGHELF